ncbi:hypothetical protein Rhe02_51960 [Rhizocola hellebori]|uniref:Uncharacterized protein n=1 Tax=Rhizocola hellebori TaxID=1392758 RepID=A0A8J3QBZ0_9ACTN|nr:hypothetical protein Rhe02_51960 [Rhizocola hellebori]
MSAAVTLYASPAHAFGGGFVRDSAICPTGKVVIGGGAQVIGEGSADFLTVIQETAPGNVGGSPRAWMTAMKNNDLFNSHSLGLYAVCADAPFSGHELVQRNVTVGGLGFRRTTVSCPAGKVSLSGGATVVGEGSANFDTVIRESGPGNQPSSSSWLVAVENNSFSSHTIAITAVCANAPDGYQIVREDHALIGNSFLRDATSCPAGKVSIGGGMQVIGDGSADFGTKLQESSPGSTPSSTAWTTAMRNGPDAHTIGTFVVCADEPDGYEIVRKRVTIN